MEKLTRYLAMRIKTGKLDYDTAVTKYPQCKAGIDELLKEA